jgi:hypothetical protein
MRKLCLIALALLLLTPLGFAKGRKHRSRRAYSYSHYGRRAHHRATRHAGKGLPPGQRRKLERTGRLGPGQERKLYGDLPPGQAKKLER